jgi:hypothetical protein
MSYGRAASAVSNRDAGIAAEGKGIGADFVNAHYGGPPIDLFPKSGSALIGTASAATSQRSLSTAIRAPVPTT